MEKFKEWSGVITLVLAFLIFMSTCNSGYKRDISSMKSKIDSMQQKIDNSPSFITKEEMKDLLKQNMYESLLLEEDIDKGNVSLSELKKEKIKNDQK